LKKANFYSFFYKINVPCAPNVALAYGHLVFLRFVRVESNFTGQFFIIVEGH